MQNFAKQMQMVLYRSENGDVSVDAYIQGETLWVTQKGMAELFGVDKSGISRHLKNIFESGELDENKVVAKIATTRLYPWRASLSPAYIYYGTNRAFHPSN